MGRCEEWSDILESFSELSEFEARLKESFEEVLHEGGVSLFGKKEAFGNEKNGAVRAFREREAFEKGGGALFQKALPWGFEEAFGEGEKSFPEEEESLFEKRGSEKFGELSAEEENYIKYGRLFENEELFDEGEGADNKKIHFFDFAGGIFEGLYKKEEVFGSEEIKRRIVKMSGGEEKSGVGDIRVEMINRTEEKSEPDVDLIIEKLGERIRDEMAKGAEGWYL